MPKKLIRKKKAVAAAKKNSSSARTAAPRKRTVKKRGKPASGKPIVKAAAVTAKPVAVLPPECDGSRLTFNHAMIYVRDVTRGIGFYRDLLGFKLIEDFRHEGLSLYARLRAPGGDGTIALHLAGPGTSIASEGVRLYFEVRDLDGFCQKLQKKGFYITQMPRMMPWGWRHAYLNDPDGHEISLYWAGEIRMQKTVMQAARQVAAAPSAKSG